MASISVELNPFPIPSGVTGLRQDGFFKTDRTMALTELSPVVLDAMCEEFRRSVFEAAGYNPLFNRVEVQERSGPDDR